MGCLISMLCKFYIFVAILIFPQIVNIFLCYREKIGLP